MTDATVDPSFGYMCAACSAFNAISAFAFAMHDGRHRLFAKRIIRAILLAAVGALISFPGTLLLIVGVLISGIGSFIEWWGEPDPPRPPARDSAAEQMRKFRVACTDIVRRETASEILGTKPGAIFLGNTRRYVYWDEGRGQHVLGGSYEAEISA